VGPRVGLDAVEKIKNLKKIFQFTEKKIIDNNQLHGANVFSRADNSAAGQNIPRLF
jgi:hypothetical protein